MKKVMVMLALFMGFSSTASAEVTVLDVLKVTPASKYELGMFQLQLMALGFNQKFAGENVNGTKFDIKDVSVINNKDTFGVILSYEGRSKYLTAENCLQLHDSKTRKLFSPDVLVNNLWPTLDEVQRKSLVKTVSLNTQLIDRDNTSITKTCGG